MKFTVERSLLADAVSRLQKVVGGKTSMPVLEGILISAEQGKLTLAAYNLEMGMKKEIYAKCEEEGDIVIDAKILSDILRRMSGVQVTISADEKLMCHIVSGEATFEIMGMAATDFPEMPSVLDGTKFNIDGSTFCDMVKGTIFAVSQTEGTRPVLTGINISVKNGILQLVAIDGFRLAIRRQRVNVEKNIEFIATGRAVNEAVKLIDETVETVEITVGKRLVEFNINGYMFISRLLEGEFVNFEKIIPTEYTQKTVMNSTDLINTVERVSLLISDAFSTPVRCAFDDNDVTFTSATSMGRAKEKCQIELQGESFEIGINSRYFLDALKACDQGDIILRFNGINSGIVLISADEANKDFLYLIMPMRLK